MKIKINCKSQLELDDIKDVDKYITYLLTVGRSSLFKDYAEYMKKDDQFSTHMLEITNRDIKNINIILENIKIK